MWLLVRLCLAFGPLRPIGVFGRTVTVLLFVLSPDVYSETQLCVSVAHHQWMSKRQISVNIANYAWMRCRAAYFEPL